MRLGTVRIRGTAPRLAGLAADSEHVIDINEAGQDLGLIYGDSPRTLKGLLELGDYGQQFVADLQEKVERRGDLDSAPWAFDLADVRFEAPIGPAREHAHRCGGPGLARREGGDRSRRLPAANRLTVPPHHHQEGTMTSPDDASREEFLAATLPGSWEPYGFPGLRVRDLWSREGGISIALLSFEKGAGIPRRHRHASNQFMYSLSGRYSYTSSGLELRPGDFYWNPMGNHHGPTEALEDSVLLEIYDGPHYFEEPGES